jgi:hypothetical protein
MPQPSRSLDCLGMKAHSRQEYGYLNNVILP